MLFTLVDLKMYDISYNTEKSIIPTICFQLLHFVGLHSISPAFLQERLHNFFHERTADVQGQVTPTYLYHLLSPSLSLWLFMKVFLNF